MILFCVQLSEAEWLQPWTTKEHLASYQDLPTYTQLFYARLFIQLPAQVE